MRVLALVLLMMFAPAGWLPTAPGQEEGAEPADDRPRVIVELSRYESVRGYVEFEDDELVFIRKLDGNLVRYTKIDLRRIIRLVEPKPGQAGIVMLNSGNVRRGIILSDSFDEVRIEMAGGVEITMPRDLVRYVQLLPTVEEQYKQFKENLTPDMVDAHLELCRWLIDKRQYALAERELVDVCERHDTPKAKKLLAAVRAYLVLERERAPVAGGRSGDDDTPELASITADILSNEDVNLIRVFEIDFNNPPKVSIDRRTIRQIIATYSTNSLIPTTAQGRDQMYRADPIDIVQLLFALRARELYADIHVLTEPPALNMFRQRVHDAFLMNNCATSRCHGGPDAGRFMLYRPHYKDKRVRYTNLLILERLQLDPQWPLINYETPEDSLIIQYGLPAAHARRPHPAVPGWRSAFRRPEDRMARRAIEWIETMLKPRMEYPVELELPMPAAKTADPAKRDAR